jgi:hypothetical protein
MKQQMEFCVMWIAARIQIVTANFDLEVLQWPGGSLIAIFLWLHATVTDARVDRHEQLGRSIA